MLRWFTKTEAELPKVFYGPLRWMHWIQGAAALTALGAVAVAMNSDKSTHEGLALRKRMMFGKCGLQWGG
jgi:hypothetical protein